MQDESIVPEGPYSVGFVSEKEQVEEKINEAASQAQEAFTQEELANIKAAELRCFQPKGKSRAGFTTNKGHGLSRKKRKVVRESKRINRGKR